MRSSGTASRRRWPTSSTSPFRLKPSGRESAIRYARKERLPLEFAHYNPNSGMTFRARATCLAWTLLLSFPSASAAQSLPSEPIVIADGLVTLGGDVSASMGSADPGFFNYTDYEHSALRMLR